VTDDSRRSAIANIFVEGAEEWNSEFEEFIRTTTYDKELGYPLPTSTDKGSETIPENGIAFDNTNNPLTFDGYADLHGDESKSGTMGIGALGGGDELWRRIITMYYEIEPAPGVLYLDAELWRLAKKSSYVGVCEV
jgi:hypothetical protein